MSVRTTSRSTLIAVSIGLIPLVPASAQDSLATPASPPHFALFTASPIFPGVSLGASGDFRWRAIPVPLRLSMAFSNADDANSAYGYSSGARLATASLELVMRPLPKLFHVQPYFLGGVGVGTVAERRSTYVYEREDGGQYFRSYVVPRRTAAFFTTGLGLDVGRMFVEAKGAIPVATNVSLGNNAVYVGFRFWD